MTLVGSVPNAGQKREAIALVNKVRGVTGVVDQIRVVDARVRPAQFQQPQVAFGGNRGMNEGGPVYDGAPMASQPGGTMMRALVRDGAPMMARPGGGSMVPDGSPIPEGPAGMAGATTGVNQPNYAWPSYAPPGNFSAVGYPTAYPWQAWPNIGPFYPYPEVPQDWRAVTLRWDDGIWWLDFKKNYTRPFFTPYPFGIFAY